MKTRKFVAFFKYLGWWNLSLGIHVDLRAPQLQIHLPTGFVAIGWHYEDPNDASTWETGLFGIDRSI
jgi:hypothetical protein